MLVFLIYACLAAVISMVFLSSLDLGRTVKALLTIAIGVLVGLLGWGAMPTINPGFPGFWWFLLSILAFCWGLPGIIAFCTDEELSARNKGFLLGLAVFFLIWIIWLFFSTSPAFHASNYQKLIGDPMESRFNEDVSPVDINRIRQVDEKLAKLLADQRLGEIPGLGSRVSVGEMNIQIINGEFEIIDGTGRERVLTFDNDLVWAGPLVHSGVFKQWSHGTTPGYVIVSAIDPGNVHLVTAVKSVSESSDEPANPRMGAVSGSEFEKIALRFMAKGAYFDSNLRRHLYTNGYFSAGITDLTFEIRDDGRPFFVATRFVKKVGFSGDDAIGVIVVDPQTGAVQEYSMDDVPKWIDRIQPEGIVRDQLDWHGKLIHGWFNSFIGREDVKKTTPGMSLVFAADGRSYWYTGMQSAGADKSTVGFFLVDTKTKDSFWYQISGATETAAKEAAESAPSVREAGFKATNPILYSVIGEPTYFMTLKGDDGLVKMFALVNVRNYQVLGVGRSVAATLRDYQAALISAGSSLDVDDLVKTVVIEAVVWDIAVEDGFYYLLLEGHKGKEFYAGAALSSELKWTRPGHKVTLEVQEGEGSSISIIKFSNKDIDL